MFDCGHLKLLNELENKVSKVFEVSRVTYTKILPIISKLFKIKKKKKIPHPISPANYKIFPKIIFFNRSPNKS